MHHFIFVVIVTGLSNCTGKIPNFIILLSFVSGFYENIWHFTGNENTTGRQRTDIHLFKLQEFK